MSKHERKASGRDDAPEPPNGYNANNSNDNGSYVPNRRYPDAGSNVSTLTKVGWFALGFFFGLLGLIVIYFLYGRRSRDTLFMSLRYVLAGVAAGLVVEFLLVGWLTSTNPELAAQILGESTGEAGSEGWTSTNF